MRYLLSESWRYGWTQLAVSGCSRFLYPKLIVSSRHHVLEDLRPYVCTFEECSFPHVNFASKKGYEYHEISQHYIKMVREEILARSRAEEQTNLSESLPKGRPHQKCENVRHSSGSHLERAASSSKPFNFRPKADGPGFEINCVFCGEVLDFGCHAVGDHIGRHLEEIAFTIVGRPHRTWDFYSEASSDLNSPTTHVHTAQSPEFVVPNTGHGRRSSAIKHLRRLGVSKCPTSHLPAGSDSEWEDERPNPAKRKTANRRKKSHRQRHVSIQESPKNLTASARYSSTRRMNSLAREAFLRRKSLCAEVQSKGTPSKSFSTTPYGPHLFELPAPPK